MKLPRKISGEELSKLLKKYDYAITQQTGSHIRLTVGAIFRLEPRKAYLSDFAERLTYPS